jgi:hypothetical protein
VRYAALVAGLDEVDRAEVWLAVLFRREPPERLRDAARQLEELRADAFAAFGHRVREQLAQSPREHAA